MIMRNIVLCVTLFCLASLFLGVPFVEAHRGTQDELDKLDEAKEDRDNAYDERDKWKGRYDGAKAAVDTLIAEWNSNKQSIKDNTYDVGNTVAATVISIILEAVLTDDPGDGGEMKGEWLKEIVEHLPILLTAINAGKEMADLFGDLNARESYLLALNAAVGALNEVISKNQVAFSTYESKYDIYVEMMQNHGGGLIRVPDYSASNNYNSVTPLSLETIKNDVKHKDAYDSDDEENMLKFWYHVDDLKSTSQASSKSFRRFKDFDTFWKRDELPSNQLCGGDCRQQFQTPVEHLVICPHALPQDAQIRDGQVTPAGCNRAYYTCKNDDRNEHRVRLCTKDKDDPNNAGQKTLCMEPYRNCKNPKYDHVSDSPGTTKHSDRRGGWVIGPTDHLNNAAPGDSQTIVCNIQGCTLTDAYDPSDTSAAALHEYCYSCYLYKCNGSDHSAASCGISGHQVCDNNSHVAASCGHSLHFVCDSLTHVEEQCSNTSNGVRCTYQFWRCLHPSVPSYGPSHTCVYGVSCGRSGCSQTVSSSTQHSATCASGHSYWTCNPSDVSLHITRTCRLSTCGKSWERCSTVGGTPLCDDPWRRSNGLPCWKK